MRPRLFSSQSPRNKQFPAGAPPTNTVNKNAILFSFSMQHIKKSRGSKPTVQARNLNTAGMAATVAGDSYPTIT